MATSLPKRLLVMGCGSIGKRHIGNLLALGAGEIIGFDTQPSRREETSAKFNIPCVASLEEAWQRAPNVALITAPTHLHLPLALEAASHGCHLFIEKPLADQLAGTDALVQAVRERNLVSLVGCNLRFHPGLRTVKQLVDDRAIGNLCAARVEVGQYLPDWHPWEDYRRNYSAQKSMGGGVILDAIHELDYIRWLLGEVCAVASFAGKMSHLEIDTEDTAAILLRFINGIIGEVHLDYVQRAKRRTCQLIGDEGTILWDGIAGSVRWYAAKTGEWKTFENPAGWELNQMYVDEMRHFLRCLAGEEKSALDVGEARRVLEIALAAKESSATGRVMELKPA